MCLSRDYLRQHIVVFNVIVLVAAVIFIAVGSWIVASTSHKGDNSEDHAASSELIRNSSLIRGMAICSLVIGCFSMLCVVIGYLGVFRDDKKITRVFTFMILALLVACLICGFITFIKQGLVQSILRRTLVNEVHERDPQKQVLLNYGYKKYGCCGIDSTPVCNIDYPPTAHCASGSSLCQNGCLKLLWKNYFKTYLSAVGILFFLLSTALTYGLILSLCYNRTINSNSEYTRYKY